MLSISYGQPEWALSSATHRPLKCNVAQHTNGPQLECVINGYITHYIYPGPLRIPW